MKNLTFSKVSMSLIALALLAVFGLAGCGGGGSGSSSGGNTGGGGESAATIQGSLTVASGDNTAQYTITNSNQSTNPSAYSSFSISVSKESPTYTYAISNNGNKVYAAVSTNADGSLTINAQSTAEALVLLNPLLIPRTKDEYATIINIVKSDDAVKSLASVIEAVYGSVEDPLSDTRISNSLTDAVKSVLSSLQVSGALPSNKLQQAKQKSSILAYAGSADSSSVQVYTYDMGALTLSNSAGSTFKLELDKTNIGQITTNVDWVAKVVELDPAKVQWFNNQLVTYNLNEGCCVGCCLSDIGSLIKTGGYQQKFIVEGEVASGVLSFVVDPIGKTADSIIGATVFPDEGILLPHDGVYAVFAYSGSPFGDSTEYNTIKNCEWQKTLWAEAVVINIGSVAIDFIGVGTTFLNAATGSDIDISPVLEVALGTIKTEITADPDHVGTAFFVEMTKKVVDELYDYLKPYIHSSISDIQSYGIKKFFHIAVNAAKSTLDVWSGTISTSTRIGNYIYSVSPRESGYGVLGTFSGQSDTTPPSPPTSVSATAGDSQTTISWNSVSGADSYNIYWSTSGGVSKTTGTKIPNVTSPYVHTGLTNGTTYYYVVTAINSYGESSESSEVSAMPKGSGTLQGYVKDAVTKGGLSGTAISIYDGSNNLVTSITTDSSGVYTATLTTGTYSLNVTKTGYISENISNVAIQENVTATVETILQVSTTYSGTGTISGTIKNALDGNGVSGVTINFRSGINVATGTIVATAATDSYGDYSVSTLNAGNYTGEAAKNGFTTAYFTITVIGGQTNYNQDATITPILSSGETRVVLTWGSSPSDLDSHLTGPISGSTSRFHVYWYDQGSSTWSPYAALDVDDVWSYGPETITISQQFDGVYRYSVRDYSNGDSTSSTALSNSSATVEVYRGSSLVATFNVPVNQGGTLWTVFEMSGDTITPINTMSYISSSSSVQAPALRSSQPPISHSDAPLMRNLPEKQKREDFQ